MGNFLKISVSIVILTLFYLWMSSMFLSCSNKSKETPEDAIDIVDDFSEDGEELVEVIDEELFEEDDTETEIIDEDTDTFESLEEDEDDDISASATTSTSSSNTSYSSSNSSGQYMVISGNYLVESNANSMKKKLENLGYNNAEIVVFDNSQYRTVIASRHSSYNDALNLSSELKRKGIDNYVKKRN